jgi:carbonic anhydrase
MRPSSGASITGLNWVPGISQARGRSEFVLEQIRKSIRLHGTRRVILMVHSDCGAYGGLAEGFRGDARA